MKSSAVIFANVRLYLLPYPLLAGLFFAGFMVNGLLLLLPFILFALRVTGSKSMDPDLTVH